MEFYTFMNCQKLYDEGPCVTKLHLAFHVSLSCVFLFYFYDNNCSYLNIFTWDMDFFYMQNEDMLLM